MAVVLSRCQFFSGLLWPENRIVAEKAGPEAEAEAIARRNSPSRVAAACIMSGSISIAVQTSSGLPERTCWATDPLPGTDFQNVAAQSLGAQFPHDSRAAGAPHGTAAEGSFE
jgi:hypothetical protein